MYWSQRMHTVHATQNNVCCDYATGPQVRIAYSLVLCIPGTATQKAATGL